MKAFVKYFFLFFIIKFPLFTATIETFYGPIVTEEPVLLELIESPSFQRLKHIHQYGIAYYTTHREEYTRYDHSLGVFAILYLKNASLEEQIAGLLHDISQTAFSHVGDWVFGKEYQEKDYHTSIHKHYLEQCGIEEILKKYSISTDHVLPLEQKFPMLEQKCPNLCADRIDYNVQGAYHQGFITHDEAMKIIANLQFIDGDWVSPDPELMKKLGRFSIFMTEDCWGSAENYLISSWFAQAIVRGIDLGYLSYKDFHFGIDHSIWNVLIDCEDPIIQKLMSKVISPDPHYQLIDDLNQADIIVKSKFRGIDPYVISDGKKIRLTLFDPIFSEEYRSAKTKIENGWAIQINNVTE